MTEEWANAVEELPFVLKQKGRMAHLLKKKSKITRAKADRKEYDAFDFLKRPINSIGSS
mgnify:CR=1 FL=1